MNPLVACDFAGVRQLAVHRNGIRFVRWKADINFKIKNKKSKIVAETNSIVNLSSANVPLATTRCRLRVNLRPSTVPEHLYVPSSSRCTSFKMADLSTLGWEGG